MADPAEVDRLWEEFHAAVNMTSRELRDWLRTESSSEAAEPFPDQAGPPTGQHVAEILSKRKTDLTDDDLRTMRRVVRRVSEARGENPDPAAGQDRWRHSLMNLGHDPLKPS